MDFPPFLCGSLWKSDFAGYQRLVIFEQKNSSLLIWGAKWIVWISWPGESHDLRIRLVAESWSNDKNHDFSIVFCWCGETPRDDFAIYFSIEIIDIYIYRYDIMWYHSDFISKLGILSSRRANPFGPREVMVRDNYYVMSGAPCSAVGGPQSHRPLWKYWRLNMVKKPKKTGTKLVLDVSNDAISIHIYFRPVHEWLLLTNELSSPPKSWWMMPCSLC